MFASDLLKQLDFDCEIHFIKLASYDGLSSSGNVQTLIGVTQSIENRAVIIIEDIVDTGRTLHQLLPELENLNPKSISVCTLLQKPDALTVDLKVDYVGFEIPNKFVVGYGLDYDNLGRIIQTNELLTNSSTSATTFTYENQTIISENNLDGDITSRVFHLNDDGIVFKEVNDNETIETIYDQGYNVVSLNSSAIPISTYTYDDTILPPENFQFFRNFIFGTYKNNSVLFENSIGGAIFSDIATIPKYHLSVTNSSFSNTFEWNFNNNGYPISRKTYDENNRLTFQIDYFYD